MIKHKRGALELSLNELIGMVLAIAGISLLLFVLVPNLWGFVSPSNEKDQANGMLTQIGNTLSSISPGQADELYVYSPALYFITFSNNQGPGGITPPKECYFLNCICICDEKCKDKVYCSTISKPLKQSGNNLNQKIPFNAFVRNDPANFEFFLGTMKEEIKDQKIISDRTTDPGFIVNTAYSLNSAKRPNPVIINYIVLHHTGGDDFKGAYDTMKGNGKSVHYMVDKDGTIYYLVDESRMAFHSLDFNAHSIGIEIVNSGNAMDSYTDAQYSALNSLLPKIVERHKTDGMAYDNAHIIGHYQTSSAIYSDGEIRKWDPSPNFDWTKINLADHKTFAQVIKEMQLPTNYLYTTLASAGYSQSFLSQYA